MLFMRCDPSTLVASLRCSQIPDSGCACSGLGRAPHARAWLAVLIAIFIAWHPGEQRLPRVLNYVPLTCRTRPGVPHASRSIGATLPIEEVKSWPALGGLAPDNNQCLIAHSLSH